jgi:hypothetical protein
LKLAQARKLALQYRLMLHEGRDPLAEKAPPSRVQLTMN